LQSSSHGTLIVPVPQKPEKKLLSRLLAKVALEALALRVLDIPVALQEVVEKKELDPLRDYARRAAGPSLWPFHTRYLYPPDLVFAEAGSPPYEVLHEWTFLYTEARELYFILALFGTEYALNMGGPELDGYKVWLGNNNGRSPLYPQGIEGIEEAPGHVH
jgi:hypothetical protein